VHIDLIPFDQLKYQQKNVPVAPKSKKAEDPRDNPTLSPSFSKSNLLTTWTENKKRQHRPPDAGRMRTGEAQTKSRKTNDRVSCRMDLHAAGIKCNPPFSQDACSIRLAASALSSRIMR
jgi:hypothetical protein